MYQVANTSWLIAGTPVDEPYPCKCDAEQCWRGETNRRHCDCYGRRDHAHMPHYCCAQLWVQDQKTRVRQPKLTGAAR